LVLCAVVVALAGCGDTHPLSTPNTPRDGVGRAVDPVLGTPAPGSGNWLGGG
jgi:hypothetical protein